MLLLLLALWHTHAIALRLTLPGDGRSWLPAHEPPVLVDLRQPAEFCASHATGAANIPIDSLKERLFELPPPGEWPLGLIGSPDELMAARGLLEPKGWSPVLLAQPDEARLGAQTSGPSDDQTWRPNSFLAAVCRALGPLPSESEPGVVLDLGCGSGRDAVYLASQLESRGAAWEVAGVDNHEAALERGRALARQNRIDARRCSFANADLRKGGLEATLEARGLPLRLIHGCRFLDVDLLCRMPPLLAPGGLLVWSTFQVFSGTRPVYI